MTTTTTTTLVPTTTTTTTPVQPLSIVETIFLKKIGSSFVQTEAATGSDSSQTKSNAFASYLSFGTVASGEKTQPIIVRLRVPNTQIIKNISLALADTGGIPFRNDVFGVYCSPELSSNIIPTTYFQGVNVSGSETDTYNIPISSADDITSNYVYLNLNFPSNYYVYCGIVKYRWFFDYCD